MVIWADCEHSSRLSKFQLSESVKQRRGSYTKSNSSMTCYSRPLRQSFEHGAVSCTLKRMAPPPGGQPGS